MTAGTRALPASLVLLMACSGSRVPLPRPDAAAVRAVEQEAVGSSRKALDVDASRRLCELLVARDGGTVALDEETRDDVVARVCAALGDAMGMEPVALTRVSPAQLRQLAERLPADDGAGAARMEAATGETEGLRWWRVHPIAADRVAALRMLAAQLRAPEANASP